MKKKYCILLRSAFLLTALFAVGACGKVNDEASLINNTGQHSANWVILHGTSAAVSTSSCTQCHGADLTGGISKVGCFSTSQSSFSGFVCHATSPAVDTGCKSCHGTPPDGTTTPNRAGAHGTHLALTSVTCTSCHQGAGFGTVNHAKGNATVSPPDTLKAKTVTTFGFDAASDKCSGIICHGGQTTPSWSTGSINVETDCLKCHELGTAPQAPQYNSFYSGQLSLSANPLVNLHKLHLSKNIPSTTTAVFCTNCHNATILDTQHFAGLTTPTFEATAASSIGGSGTLINNYVPYTSSAPSGSCTSSCHSVINDNPRYWVSP